MRPDRLSGSGPGLGLAVLGRVLWNVPSMICWASARTLMFRFWELGDRKANARCWSML
jgi:hypothetical protein